MAEIGKRNAFHGSFELLLQGQIQKSKGEVRSSCNVTATGLDWYHRELALRYAYVLTIAA